MSRPSPTVKKPKISKRFSLPLYGTLNIDNFEKFMLTQRQIFHRCFLSPCPLQKTVDKFEALGLLGEGGFGKVYLVVYKKREKLYAMKRMEKKFLVENDFVAFALNEKRILQSLNFPFCVRLEYLSQDKSSLYYFLPFISGGELYTHLKNLKRFSENLCKFYASQVILAIEFLHFCDLVYRDLKPENILIDHTGYVKVTDFGFTKEVKKRLYTFCGTPEYIAPEIILGHGYSKAVDYWSLGVLIFELVRGKTPFHNENDPHNENELDLFNRIVSCEYEMPKTFSEPLQDLIHNLIQIDTTKRFGNLHRGIEDIKEHHWFQTIDWLSILNRQTTPLFIPDEADIFNNFPKAEEVNNLFQRNDSKSNYEVYFQEF